MTRPLALAVAAALAAGLSACAGGSLSDTDKAQRCAAFAEAVAPAHLTTTPDEQTAKRVADSLDPLLSRLSTPALHDPAVRVHQLLHAVETASRQGDAGRADEAAAKARTQLEALASACGLPVADFLGTG